ncbi:MAG TPA: glyoxalase/bleomycin resistance/dioxygenase family protein [Bacteroidetes bacterium]|nr:glyoxalase/bleomycin resistance/dioxygenase family protein [Bacteroidota bacterium]
MKIEHFAFNVKDPISMSKWYSEHLGLKTVKQVNEDPFTTFMADNSGRVMIEFYNNPADNVPRYGEMHPLLLHLAFVSEDPASDKKRLLEAGATLVSEDKFEDGTHLLMLRDPWGFSIQFCKRGTPMLSNSELS